MNDDEILRLRELIKDRKKEIIPLRKERKILLEMYRRAMRDIDRARERIKELKEEEKP